MRLYNTLSRKLETITPQNDQVITLYTCGPTVYDYLHIGNWTAYVRWDILARTIIASGFKLKWVMNITDVGHLVSDADEGEDKLEKGARREGKSAWEVADFYTQDFLRGLIALSIDTSNFTIVKATDHIKQQVDLIKKLETKGYTYITSDGVYFDTSRLGDYGKLARLDTKGQKAGARVSMGEKRHLPDFALWKFSPKDKQRDMEWDSPWGKGFPGWHIECSAMSMHYLGSTLDIHAGGIDHIPVHHTNEIAQSEAATGLPFSRYWIHSNFMKVDGEKIAKSLNNGINLQTIVEKNFQPADIRMLILQSHYRTESHFTWDILESARSRRLNWQQTASLRWQPVGSSGSDIRSAKKIRINMLDALQNDLSTPEALKIIDIFFEGVQAEGIAKEDLLIFTSVLESIRSLLGIDLFDEDISDEQKLLLSQREQARANNEWARADQLRDKLLNQKIGVRDTASGPFWYRR